MFLSLEQMATSPRHRLRSSRATRISLCIAGVAGLAAVSLWAFPVDAPTSMNPSTMPAIGSVDSRFQSYNIEMLEVTGGRFWKPYKDINAAPATPPSSRGAGSTPAGMSPDLYEYRPPINLSNPRLRKLAAALGPAYVRVSGTWANTTYFLDSDGPAPATPPKGFNGVLTRAQWKGVVDFARAANAEIVTSVAISPGVRNADGVWTPDQARAFLDYTKSIGGSIAAAEFMNEPNLAMIGGAPRGYDAAAYAKDVAVFGPFLKKASPGTLFLGPGSVAEGKSVTLPANLGLLRSEDLLKATGPVFDIFSYHLYPAISKRCAAMSPSAGTTAAAALTEEWFSRADTINAFYTDLRDRFDPGKPLWITEIADASCGGNPWASTFLDTFRYLDTHARLAQKSVKVLLHNTLDASDYALLDEHTFEPRPNYWAALLWHKLMGATVLKPSAQSVENLNVYAQCAVGMPGGVTVLAINADRTASKTLALSADSERYTLTAPDLEGTRVDLNGKELRLGNNDALSAITGVGTKAGDIILPPASISFFSVREAHNAACR